MSERNDHLDYLLLSWASAREAEPARLEALAARVCGEARKVEATAAAQEHKTLVLGHKRRAPGEAVDRYLASRGKNQEEYSNKLIGSKIIVPHKYVYMILSLTGKGY